MCHRRKTEKSTEKKEEPSERIVCLEKICLGFIGTKKFSFATCIDDQFCQFCQLLLDISTA